MHVNLHFFYYICCYTSKLVIFNPDEFIAVVPAGTPGLILSSYDWNLRAVVRTAIFI